MEKTCYGNDDKTTTKRQIVVKSRFFVVANILEKNI